MKKNLPRLEPDSPVPLYAQIEAQMEMLIAAGAFEPGAQVPSVRELAIRLGVNPLTVSKAYGRLADRGIVRTQRGRGVFVAMTGPALSTVEREKLVAGRLASLVTEARAMGVPDQRVEELLKKALKRRDLDG